MLQKSWLFRSLHEKILDKSGQTDDFPIISSEVLLLSYSSLRGRRNRGRGRGAREARKNEGDWGEGRGNACHKNPIRFISAFAGKRKFLIG